MFSSRVDKRIDSFGRKGSKNGTKSWPFTNQQAKKKLLDAEYLAKLGFHFNNTTKDHVVCHFCDLECDWSTWGVALIRNNQVSSVLNLHQHEQVLKDLDYQSLLLETFQDWPYNRDKKGQKTPSAQQMSTAGFCCQPMTDSPDHACCLFCSTSLENWDSQDDPVAEHRKRSADCEFFVSFYQEPKAVTEGKSAKSKKIASKKAAKKSQKQESEVEEEDIESIAEVSLIEPVGTAAVTFKPKSKRGAAGKKNIIEETSNNKPVKNTKKVLKSREKDEIDVDQTQDDASKDILEEIALPVVVKKRGGRKAKPASEEQENEVPAVVIEEPEKKKRGQKGKKISGTVPVAPAPKTRKGRSAAPNAKRDSLDETSLQISLPGEEEANPEEEDVEEALPIEEVTVAPKPKKGSGGRKKKANAKSVPVKDIAEDQESFVGVAAAVPDDYVEEVRVVGSKKRSLTAAAVDNQEVESMSVKEAEIPVKKRGRPAKKTVAPPKKAKTATTSKAKSKPKKKQGVQEEVDEEEVVEEIEEEDKENIKSAAPKTGSNIPLKTNTLKADTVKDSQDNESLQQHEAFSFPANTSVELLQLTQKIMNKSNLSETQVNELYRANENMPSLEFMEMLGRLARDKVDAEWTQQMQDVGF